MKHLKLFNNEINYNTWLSSDNYVTPYVSKNKNNGNINYQIRIPLPYDAKILYLESSGEQYINLDYAVWNHGLSGDIVMQRLGDSTDEHAYVGRTNQSGVELYTIGYQKIGLWIASDSGQHDLESNEIGTTIDKEIHHVLFGVYKNENDNNGTLYLKVDNNEYSMNVERYNNEYKANLQLFSHRGYYNSTGRIYSCKLWDNGVMIYDLIPVRKDGVGYMYDKLSNKLFGNSASGAPLILGPDK